MISLATEAERRAATVNELESFSGFDLLHVKRSVAELLRHVGEQGIFDEYTRHDIQHIEAMLAMLQWLIPEDTQEIMTPVDWLLVVLSIYFHDLGMLVTKEEYRTRAQSTYPDFRRKKLLSLDSDGTDYQKRILDLPEDEREKFLYQEFVRSNHATRIRHWIEYNGKSPLGSAEPVVREIQNLLQYLDPVFRSDLAVVCESHHENDLENVDKYLVRRPYGNTSAEIANVQYAAIILRTTDLLQITRDRTPSIAFRVLTPTDPISHVEWSKQMAVRAVIPQPARDADGNVTGEIDRSVIEVHARFENNADGFFGLTSYIAYASQQLKESYEWVANSRKRHGTQHRFPWTAIDHTRIETIGFERKQYRFQIHQEKILQLLTGHTLYNDTNVAIRELTQNAIDAVRLAYSEVGGRERTNTEGAVRIRWNSKTRILEFHDNGTGMTQEIIENNFLHVGASRYQDSRFREEYPFFNPISRFGIGVLSAFMIADQIEVYTSHSGDKDVRRISLRNVTGRYLIRVLDPQLDETAASIAPHGTLVQLRVRASAEMDDVVEAVKKWFVLPNCRLSVSVDDGPEQTIGSSSLKTALQNSLLEKGYVTQEALDSKTVEIREAQRGAVTVAYGVIWSKWFRCWELLNIRNTHFVSSRRRTYRYDEREEGPLVLGTCIEGVRVDFSSPGYDGIHMFAIANAKGPDAPKTNVARSEFAESQELSALIRDVYGLYLDHIANELRELYTDRGFSLTRACADIEFCVTDLIAESYDRPRNVALKSTDSLQHEIRKHDFLVIEDKSDRRVVSLENIAQSGSSFFTITDRLLSSAEEFLRNLPKNHSLRALLSNLDDVSLDLPSGPILARRPRTGLLRRIFQEDWVICSLVCDLSAERIMAEWKRKGSGPSWAHADFNGELYLGRVIAELNESVRFANASRARIWVPEEGVSVQGLDEYEGVRIDTNVYLSPHSDVVRLVKEAEESQRLTTVGSTIAWSLYGLGVGLNENVNRPRPLDTMDVLESQAFPIVERVIGLTDEVGALREILQAARFNHYDVNEGARWRR